MEIGLYPHPRPPRLRALFYPLPRPRAGDLPLLLFVLYLKRFARPARFGSLHFRPRSFAFYLPLRSLPKCFSTAARFFAVSG